MPPAADGRPAPPAKRARRVKPPLETVAPHAATAADTRFARALASPDPSTRARALDALGAWLGARAPGGVPRGDMLKLWAGVFYAFWHSDLGPVQVKRVEELPICGVVGVGEGGEGGALATPPHFHFSLQLTVPPCPQNHTPARPGPTHRRHRRLGPHQGERKRRRERDHEEMTWL